MSGREVPRALVINDAPVTVAVDPEVQRAIESVIQTATITAALDSVLAPFGLTAFHIANPEYRRVVTPT